MLRSVMMRYGFPSTRRPIPYTLPGLCRVASVVVPTFLFLVAPSWLQGQPARKATTLSALLTYPVFFHGERIAVRAESWGDRQLMWLVDGEARVLTLGEPVPGPGERVEVVATFWDVGRLEPGDSRLSQLNLADLSETLLKKPWPSTGELPVLAVESTLSPTRPPEPTVRTIALEPEDYEGERVTVTGRFRGRNLYGDLPEAPGKSSWDFVLQSADGAIWVTGIEPRGREFHLDVTARVDTGRWLEVTGVVHRTRDLVSLDATEVTLAQPPAAAARTSRPAAVPRQGPPPEVIFSAPTQDDADVPRDTLVRIQFSRDMDPDSFKDEVRVGYVLQESFERGEQPPAVEFDVEYRRGKRVLELRFSESLDPFRTMMVELLEGITATDGVPLQRWTLTFALGG